MKNNEGLKKTLKAVGNVILWIFLIFAILMTVIAISATSNSDGVPSIGGKMILTVATDSMEPTIMTGDLIIVDVVADEDVSNLKVDDVITFVDTDLSEDGMAVLNTHRIVEVITDDNGDVLSYRTQGDNRDTCPIADTTLRAPTDVRGIYTGVRLAGVGSVLEFLQTQTGFLVCVVLPVLVFFIYEIIVVVRTATEMKNAGKKVISVEDEEMIKQKAIEEYLRQQAAASEATAPAEAEQQNEENKS